MLDHAYRILIIGGSRSGKANALINLIIHEPYIDRIYLQAKHRYESIYQYLMKTWEKVGLKHHNYAKAFIEYCKDSRMFIKMLMGTIQEKNVSINRVWYDCWYD